MSKVLIGTEWLYKWLLSLSLMPIQFDKVVSLYMYIFNYSENELIFKKIYNRRTGEVEKVVTAYLCKKCKCNKTEARRHDEF